MVASSVRAVSGFSCMCRIVSGTVRRAQPLEEDMGGGEQRLPRRGQRTATNRARDQDTGDPRRTQVLRHRQPRPPTTPSAAGSRAYHSNAGFSRPLFVAWTRRIWLLEGTRLAEAERLCARPGFRDRLKSSRQYLEASRIRENRRFEAFTARPRIGEHASCFGRQSQVGGVAQARIGAASFGVGPHGQEPGHHGDHDGDR